MKKLKKQTNILKERCGLHPPGTYDLIREMGKKVNNDNIVCYE